MILTLVGSTLGSERSALPGERSNLVEDKFNLIFGIVDNHLDFR